MKSLRKNRRSVVGFTGTRKKLTLIQHLVLSKTIAALYPREFHHGGCRGADEEAHQIISLYPTKVIIHPGVNDKGESPDAGAIIPTEDQLAPKPYLVRNHDIVDACDILIACSGTAGEQLRSGTWATVRYAFRIKKPVIIIYPNGTIERLPK